MGKLVASVVLVLSLGGLSYWFFTCPCDRIPGGYLLGAEVAEPVGDWSFANDVTLCQVQINAGFLPHSINLNCMATNAGDLYLSCSDCGTKRWSNAVLGDGTARLRLYEDVYPVNLTRVMDDRAQARGGAHVGARHASPSVHFGAMVHVVWMIMVVV